MGSTTCRVCGRRLTHPESVKRGIGPVCWARIQKERIAEEEPRGELKILDGTPTAVSKYLRELKEAEA